MIGNIFKNEANTKEILNAKICFSLKGENTRKNIEINKIKLINLLSINSTKSCFIKTDTNNIKVYKNIPNKIKLLGIRIFL